MVVGGDGGWRWNVVEVMVVMVVGGGMGWR